MKERHLLRFSVLVFWTLFWGLSVVDKIIPDVQHLWVGKDFFALFVKFFGSLGLKDPLFATVALAVIAVACAIVITLEWSPSVYAGNCHRVVACARDVT